MSDLSVLQHSTTELEPVPLPEPSPPTAPAAARAAPSPASRLLGRLLGRGRTADVHAWGDDRVLKLYHEWCPDAWVRREVDTASVVEAGDLPAPRLLGVLAVGGREGIVYERVTGPSLLATCERKPWRVRHHGERLAELQAEIHRHGGDDLQSVKDALRERIEDARGLPAALGTAVLAQLARLPDGGALCHFDFHPDQVLLSAQGPLVIDWATALRGDPAADVARTLLLLQLGHLPYGDRVQHAVIGLWRRTFRNAYLSRYLALRPDVTRARVRAWLAPVAAARLVDEIAGEREALVALIGSTLELPREHPREATPPVAFPMALVDRVLPRHDATLVRAVVVDAPAAVTYAAITEANIMDGVVRALFVVRELPRRIAAWLRRAPLPPTPRRLTFGDLLAREPRPVVLAEEWGNEVVIGSVGRFWQRDYGHRPVAASEFTSFAEPGWAKLAISFRVTPLDDGQSLLRYEARTATTDVEARRRFRRYWLLIRPGVALVMWRALRLIRAHAEAQPQ